MMMPMQKTQDLTKPFTPQIFADVIAKHYFDGPLKFTITRRPKFFDASQPISIIDGDPVVPRKVNSSMKDEDQKVIPKVILAMTGTMVCAVRHQLFQSPLTSDGYDNRSGSPSWTGAP